VSEVAQDKIAAIKKSKAIEKEEEKEKIACQHCVASSVSLLEDHIPE
jgi:hypothetical protein